MTQPLQLPLPSEVDVSDLPFMPLQDGRLMKSRAWMKAKNWRGQGGPGLAFCLVNLWIGAFRSKPCGSLDDDDDMLANEADCDISFWHQIKAEALRGWESHGGRIWHPVVCEIGWPLWLARLSYRHSRALDSHRAAAKRALDKGKVPPDPPGGLLEWMQSTHPQTFAYQAALPRPTDKVICTDDKRENLTDFEPKGRKGKDIPPITPHGMPPEGLALMGLEGGSGRTPAERKAWYARELARLEAEFGPMLVLMRSYLQSPGVQWKFGLVRWFKGCWLVQHNGAPSQIVVPSIGRAKAILKTHGEWLQTHWPGLTVRHAQIDELRARRAA